MEIIEPIPDGNARSWTPVIGTEVQALKEYLRWDDASLDRLERETIRIMEFCGDPDQPTYDETGLVIGYVQSGKTVSFTTLTAMARDNGYQMVIIIAGMSTNLVNQSTQRLMTDLQLNHRHDRAWTLFTNPSTPTQRNGISSILSRWRDNTWHGPRQTILITVMKNSQHLNNLIQILRPLDLQGVPTLIIDDEGDQASLNTRARANARSGLPSESELSTIYRRITSLKTILPHHTLLQYTATPQAPLFINIMDWLSPNFIKLLTPGDAYTGGKTFFIDNPNLIRVIPQNQIPSNENTLTEPPATLIEAMRTFFLGVAAGLHQYEGNRSMMVHPSRTTDEHQQFYNWVTTIKTTWVETLQEEGEDRNNLLREFQTNYDDLVSTVPDLESFGTLCSRLKHSIEYCQVIQVNTRGGRTPSIPWRDHYPFILVGGQSLDRGFTVEGLTVTYMPRSIGTGNADTLQQRARFFGYKLSYLGYCRVYLDAVTRIGYQEYVDHEEDIRNKLSEHDLTNKPLNDWDRHVVLDQLLNLCRGNILTDDLQRNRFGEEWVTIRAPHDSDSIIARNRQAVQNFIREYHSVWEEDPGHMDRTQEQRHLTITIPLSECFAKIFENVRFTRLSDSGSFTSMKSVVNMYLEEHPDTICEIYLMTVQDILNWNARERRLNRRNEVQQLFQGRNPRTGVAVYPGDRNIGNKDNLIVQIHKLNLKEENEIRYRDVIGLAIWIPNSIGRDMIQQPDNRIV